MGATVVTGCGRSGTSLVMQTLRLLGFPIVGLEYHEQFNNRELHPHGCWDLPIEETLNGIHGNKYDGKGIKLFAYQLIHSSPDSIERVIVCYRHREETIQSLMRLLASSENIYGVAPTREVATSVYNYSYENIEKFLEVHAIPRYNVNFGMMIQEPDDNIASIAAFVGMPGCDIASAIVNVIRG